MHMLEEKTVERVYKTLYGMKQKKIVEHPELLYGAMMTLDIPFYDLEKDSLIVFAIPLPAGPIVASPKKFRKLMGRLAEEVGGKMKRKLRLASVKELQEYGERMAKEEVYRRMIQATPKEEMGEA